MLLAVGEKVPPLCAAIISTRKPSRVPQDSYCRTLGACQETDTDGGNQGTKHCFQGLSGHPEAGIGSTRKREHLDTFTSLGKAGVISPARKSSSMCVGWLDWGVGCTEVGHL